MPPQYAIAPSERPLNCAFAAGGTVRSGESKCYESFTLKALLFGASLRTFARVMTGRKPTLRTASGGVFRVSARASRTNFAARQFSARNVLSFTSDLRPLTSEI